MARYIEWAFQQQFKVLLNIVRIYDEEGRCPLTTAASSDDVESKRPKNTHNALITRKVFWKQKKSNEWILPKTGMH